MDNLSHSQRRKNMQHIRSKDTAMEIVVRSELHKHGYRFRKNVLSLPGRPDIVFPKARLVVFLDSCFWHQCPYHSVLPKTNRAYWLPKLKKNKLRAKIVGKLLKKDRWTVLRFWEHQLVDQEKVISKIELYLNK
jgi:DNA mismatch endonuclease (patch repair protein)